MMWTLKKPHNIDMSCESYMKQLWKSHDWEATISTLNINVEVNQVQVQHPNSSTTSTFSVCYALVSSPPGCIEVSDKYYK